MGKAGFKALSTQHVFGIGFRDFRFGVIFFFVSNPLNGFYPPNPSINPSTHPSIQEQFLLAEHNFFGIDYFYNNWFLSQFISSFNFGQR